MLFRSLRAALNNDRVVIQQLSARSNNGGTVSGSGTVGLKAPFPADLRVRTNNLRYADGTLVVATVDTDITLTGPLTGGATLGGTVHLRHTEITVPETLPGNAVAVQVKHRAPPPAVQRTLNRALPKSRPKKGGSGGATHAS